MEKTLNTYRAQVREYLESGRGITQEEAREMFGCSRLSAIIFLLKKDGLNIFSITEHGENRNGHRAHWSRYYLEK